MPTFHRAALAFSKETSTHFLFFCKYPIIFYINFIARRLSKRHHYDKTLLKLKVLVEICWASNLRSWVLYGWVKERLVYSVFPVSSRVYSVRCLGWSAAGTFKLFTSPWLSPPPMEAVLKNVLLSTAFFTCRFIGQCLVGKVHFIETCSSFNDNGALSWMLWNIMITTSRDGTCSER